MLRFFMMWSPADHIHLRSVQKMGVIFITNDYEDIPDVLNMRDLQKILGVCRNTAYRLIHENRIGYLRIGKTIRIPKVHFIDYIENGCDTIHSNGRQISADAVSKWR